MSEPADRDERRRQALARLRDSGIVEAMWPSNERAEARLEEIVAQLDDDLIDAFFPRGGGQFGTPGRGLAGTIDELGAKHALTGAERRVLTNLCAGLSLKEQASQSGVSRNTLRSQTQKLLEKTGTHSQQELISLVFRHATAR